MTDIVERLRDFPDFVEMRNENYEVYGLERSIESVAADKIETLRQRVKELEGYKEAWVKTSKCRDRAEKELVAERAISDKLEKALKECGSNLALTYKQIMSICNEALAEVAAMRKGETE